MKNKKGFVLTETLMVTVFLVTIFTFIYTSVIPLIGVYRDKAERMENVDVVYKIFGIRNMLKKDANQISITRNNIKKITCYDLAKADYCINLLRALEIDDYDLYYTKSVKKNYNEIIALDNEIKNYIEPYKETDEGTLIFKDNKNHTIVHLQMKNNIFSLYNVLKSAALENNGASTYTGLHNDDPLISGNKTIYYYNGTNNQKNNVIFGGFCWKMIRTTDTGGVKLLYNGIASNNQCLNQTNYIGTTSFNTNDNSLSDVGYMYNDRYPVHNLEFASSKEMIYQTNSYNNIYYAATVSYNGTYTLNSPVQASSLSELDGKYTFLSTSSQTRATVNYVLGHDSNTLYYLTFSGGKTVDDIKYIGGTGIAYNASTGKYTLSNTKNFTATDCFHSALDNLQYFCLDNMQNSTCNSPVRKGGYLNLDNSIYATGFWYYRMINYKTSSTFTYGSNTYRLTSPSNIQYWSDTTSNNKTTRYTCFSSNDNCMTQINYIFYSDDYRAHYVTLQNGTGISNAISNMLDSNVTSSKVKTVLEKWYLENMLSYADYIENTTYCANRSINSYSGWLAGSDANDNDLKFTTNNSLYCDRVLDSFNTSNNSAKLVYPVGLMTYQEASLLGSGGRGSGVNYWLLSPADFKGNPSDTESAYIYYVTSKGTISSAKVSSSYAVRPVISLKMGASYAVGDGSSEKPYIIL